MIRRHRKTEILLSLSLILSDIFWVILSLFLTYWFRFTSGVWPSPLGIPRLSFYVHSFGLITATIILTARHLGLYNRSRLISFLDESLSVFKAVALSFLILMAFTFLFRDFSYSRSFLSFAWVAVIVSVWMGRFLMSSLIGWYERRKGRFTHVLLIGGNDKADKLIRYFKDHPRLRRSVLGVVGEKDKSFSNLLPIQHLGKLEQFKEVLERHSYIGEVILTLDNLPREKIVEMIFECEKNLIAFRWAADFLSLAATQMEIYDAGGVSLLSFKETPLAEWENRLLKRIFDIGLALFSLVVFSPIIAAVIAMIKLTSKGTIIYKQERVGEDGKVFEFYKFRTMEMDAEKETGPVWAKPNDERRTRLGAFLRENNLDELPQLWNVLKGDMSLVGPRPERPFFVGQFKEDIPRYMSRHKIKSGITGWAQVNGFRGDTSILERTKYDLYYIENWSLFLDIKILFMTFFAKRNAY